MCQGSPRSGSTFFGSGNSIHLSSSQYKVYALCFCVSISSCYPKLHNASSSSFTMQSWMILPSSRVSPDQARPPWRRRRPGCFCGSCRSRRRDPSIIKNVFQSHHLTTKLKNGQNDNGRRLKGSRCFIRTSRILPLQSTRLFKINSQKNVKMGTWRETLRHFTPQACTFPALQNDMIPQTAAPKVLLLRHNWSYDTMS